MLKKTFMGKRILVTGHTGFKGTWLIQILNELGAIVCGFSLPIDDSSFYIRVNMDIYSSIEGDIRDLTLLENVIRSFQPEMVIHLASHSSLQHSKTIPRYIYQTNMIGVVNLFEGIRKNDSVKAVLIVTSDKCYKNSGSGKWYDEREPLGAADPYSTSKACQELITESYYRTFFSGEKSKRVNIATARASNVIGGGDFNQSRLIPYLLTCFESGVEASLRKPMAIRPWQNILDVLYGYLLLLEKLYVMSEDKKEYYSTFNFGPKEDGFATVGEIAGFLAQCFDGAVYQFDDSAVEQGNNDILKLNSNKAKEVLKWNSRFTLKETLKQVVEFEKSRRYGKSLREICSSYILNYFERND